MVLQHLWFARNQAIHKEIKFSPNKELQVVLKKFIEHRVMLTDVPLVLPKPERGFDFFHVQTGGNQLPYPSRS